MTDEISENSEVYNRYLELSKPTEDDFKRVFTEDELKELCIKHKCKVNMWRWNVVNEYRIVFTERGRYQRWTPRDRLRMLSKAVNKMKPAVLYDEEEITKSRRKEWEEQLKENILSLNFWKRQRLCTPRLEMLESDDIAKEVQSQCEVNTESMNLDEMWTQTETRKTQSENIPIMLRNSEQEVELEIEVNTQSMNATELLTQPQKQSTLDINTAPSKEINSNELIAYGRPLSNGQVTATGTTQAVERNVLVDFFDDTELILEGDSEDSIETVLHNENQNKLISTETLNSEEVAPDIQNMYDVNTVSMTIDSQMSTQSQGLPMLQSQDVIPANYENFKNIIPLTSTQSQSEGSENVLLVDS